MLMFPRFFVDPCDDDLFGFPQPNFHQREWDDVEVALKETPTEVVVMMLLPGVRRRGLHAEVKKNGRLLVVKGAWRGGLPLRAKADLPPGLDTARMSASFLDTRDILVVTIPRETSSHLVQLQADEATARQGLLSSEGNERACITRALGASKRVAEEREEERRRKWARMMVGLQDEETTGRDHLSQMEVALRGDLADGLERLHKRAEEEDMSRAAVEQEEEDRRGVVAQEEAEERAEIVDAASPAVDRIERAINKVRAELEFEAFRRSGRDAVRAAYEEQMKELAVQLESQTLCSTEAEEERRDAAHRLTQQLLDSLATFSAMERERKAIRQRLEDDSCTTSSTSSAEH